jgi:predicted small lipoprotein YifL
MFQRAASSRKAHFPALGASLALVAAMSTLAACGREQPAKAPPPANAAASAAASAAAADSGHATMHATALPAARSKAQGMAALMALPELKAWSGALEKSSGGAVRGALIEYDPKPRLIGGKSYWQFSFVENGSDAAHPRESFLVAERGDEILVDDLETDGTLSLEQWRKQKRPLERGGAR